MTIGRTRASVLVATMFVASLAVPAAHAAISTRQKCTLAIAKASHKYVAGKLKLLQKCKNANFKDGSCAVPDSTKLDKLDSKFLAALDKGCALTPTDFQLLGFPGPCPDANVGDGFTLADLKDCMLPAHNSFISASMDLAYDPTITGTLGKDDLKCQAEVGKQAAAYANCVLKNVSKCRDGILKGKPIGVPPDFCATNYPKASTAIQKCKDKLISGIDKKCDATQITNLKICTPDQTDAASAATCLIDSQTVLLDGPEIIVPPDLIDYEYAVRGGLCGDNIVNNLNEECDGPDAAACPGQCGTATDPDGYFACLCKTKPRMVISEHSDADTDNGWKGLSVDGHVVEGGGYIIDLYDCDMSGLCNAGPHCSDPPHSPCGVSKIASSGTTSDSICAFLGEGTCRKERTATGPHCFQDINKKCDEKKPYDPVCSGPGDFCMTTFHGAPVAAAAGGIAVCNVSTFTEDVVGTVNLTLGTSSVTVRQAAVTYNPITQSKPCPVCGGFCGVSRERCDVMHPCAPGAGTCIDEAVCSDGLRQDKACRRTPPFGGDITFFGTTSVDCPPNTGTLTNTTTGGLDINANPRTTGSVTLLPSFNCTQAGYTNKACLGGSSEYRPCTVDSECPGGTCTGQCPCSGQKQPNDCGRACVGGGNEAQPCTVDGDCPGGFCHPADCRVNLLDMDSNQEGECTNSPPDQFCSLTTYRSCNAASDCQPSAACPFCQAGETCDNKVRQCFVNSGIIRIGMAGTPERETASVYCVPTNGGAIDASAGFGGPGALIQHEHVFIVP
jgi:hypothetical protein